MKKTEKAFKWVVLINCKAIDDFEKRFNINSKRISSDHYLVLSFIADICLNKKKSNKLKSEIIYGKKYSYMSSYFILKNMPILKFQKRTLVRHIQDLEKYGYIERVVL